MGSHIHAQPLNDRYIPVYGMIAIEMIGFYRNEKGSQGYSLKPMKVVYGTGDG